MMGVVPSCKREQRKYQIDLAMHGSYGGSYGGVLLYTLSVQRAQVRVESGSPRWVGLTCFSAGAGLD